MAIAGKLRNWLAEKTFKGLRDCSNFFNAFLAEDSHRDMQGGSVKIGKC
jgi:hypothetical protein